MLKGIAEVSPELLNFIETLQRGPWTADDVRVTLCTQLVELISK